MRVPTTRETEKDSFEKRAQAQVQRTWETHKRALPLVNDVDRC